MSNQDTAPPINSPLDVQQQKVKAMACNLLVDSVETCGMSINEILLMANALYTLAQKEADPGEILERLA